MPFGEGSFEEEEIMGDERREKNCGNREDLFSSILLPLSSRLAERRKDRKSNCSLEGRHFLAFC